jgi:hypothetical protein
LLLAVDPHGAWGDDTPGGDVQVQDVGAGPRALGSLHLSYFDGGLSLLGGWYSGYESYGLTSNTRHTKVPIESYLVQAAYLHRRFRTDLKRRDPRSVRA